MSPPVCDKQALLAQMETLRSEARLFEAPYGIARSNEVARLRQKVQGLSDATVRERLAALDRQRLETGLA